MVWVLFLLFVAMPIAEIAVLIRAGEWLGLWPTIGLVILTAMAGAALARAEGRAAMRRLAAAVEQGGTPIFPLLDAAAIFVGGLLLLTPGFITDTLGLSLLFRPTRLLWGGLIVWLQRGRAAGRTGPGPGPGPGPTIIEGEYTEHRDDRPPGPDLPPRP